MKYPRGLIRFTSQHELDSGKTRFFRPRLFGYFTAVIVMVTAFVTTIATRSPLSVDVIRDRGARLYRVSGNTIQNVYTVKINNMDNKPHVYSLVLGGDLPYVLKNYRPTQVEGGEVFTLPLRIAVPKNEITSEKNNITFIVTASDDESLVATEENIFIGPVKRKK